jgi:uncharacterized protein (TIGR02118 family)
MKLIAIYKTPADSTSFDEAYFNTHLPLIAKVPGLQKTVVTRFTRNFVGDGFYMMAEMYFPDLNTAKVAMRSTEMAAAGENLNSFARDQYFLMFGEEQ